MVEGQPQCEVGADGVAEDVNAVEPQPVQDGPLQIGDGRSKTVGAIGDRRAQSEARPIHQQQSTVRHLPRKRGERRTVSEGPVHDQQRWARSDLHHADSSGWLVDLDEALSRLKAVVIPECLLGL